MQLFVATVILISGVFGDDQKRTRWPRFQVIANQLETSEKWHRFGVVAETREYACARKSSRATKSDCELKFGELSAINDNGCFMHFDAVRQESVELCPLQCQRFTEAKILKTSDSLICSPGVAVGVERRQSDWFMWRSGACRSSDVIFQLECSMSRPGGLEAEEGKGEAEPEQIDEPMDNGIGDADEGVSSSIEDITSIRQETTTLSSGGSGGSESSVSSKKSTVSEKSEIAENEDDLPEKVDTLLGFMFPSYRRKSH